MDLLIQLLTTHLGITIRSMPWTYFQEIGIYPINNHTLDGNGVPLVLLDLQVGTDNQRKK